MRKHLQRLQVNLHWLHAWLCRGVLGQNSPATMESVEILYKSANFIVVNKHYDVKINSNDSSDKITVATQLAYQFPELVDASVTHQFRYNYFLKDTIYFDLDFVFLLHICVFLKEGYTVDLVYKNP